MMQVQDDYYTQFLVQDRLDIIREVQTYCADLHEEWEKTHGPEGGQLAWTAEDAQHVAEILNRDKDPWGLFSFMDEKTGHFSVGYKTRDGREWFYILRQMRNTVDSGLFEYLRKGPA